MTRSENIAYLRIHKLLPDCSINSAQLQVDCETHRVLGQLAATSVDVAGVYARLLQAADGAPACAFTAARFDAHTDSSIRVIRLGAIDALNPLNIASELFAGLPEHHQLQQHVVAPITSTTAAASTTSTTAAGSTSSPNEAAGGDTKVPNIPMMIRCQNCDTNFPTKYQYQRHQCEFNADKVVLKANVDAKDGEKGMRMKFDCGTCGKQFVSKSNLERHLTSHDAANANVCEYCSKHFVSENRLRIHKENHCKKAGDISKFYRSDVTVWRCAKCCQVFSTMEFAQAHVDTCHEPVGEALPSSAANEDISEVQNMPVFKLECKVELTEHGGGLSSSGAANKHVQKVRTELLLQCEFCNRTYANKKSLLWHQDRHTTHANYNCVVCTEIFPSFALAAKHWLTKCTSEANLFFLPKLIYCKCCDRTFKSHDLLYTHKIKKKHYTAKRHDVDDGGALCAAVAPPTSDSSENVKVEKGESKETIIKLIEDVLCSIKHKINEEEGGSEAEGVQDALKTEMAAGNQEAADVEAAAETVKPTRKRRGRKRKHPVQSKLKRACANVEPGFKYQCERCVDVFDTIIDLETHRNKEHPANYKCEECDQVVHSAKALVIHSRAHQSLKPYVCEICKRCYSQTSHLWQHMRFHQGIKPFACPHEGCEARYTIRPDLKDHIRKVHTRERPFKCTVCDKCFLTGSVYYQHRLIHTNDRRYACDICNKRFFRADALNNHRRIHTDERPYPCNVCGRHFRQKGDRNKHVRTQHPDYHLQEVHNARKVEVNL